MSSGLQILLKENKQALFFLIKFVGLYLILNTLYGLFVEFYSPEPDPITWLVSHNTQAVLSLFHEAITMQVSGVMPHVVIQKEGVRIINVYEGCNSVNVMIVFTVFVIAFSGPKKIMGKFIVFGILMVYAMNLLRVTLLFWVAYYFPNSLYFFHKYFFTALIYAGVFVLWYMWIKKVRINEPGTTRD